ncbi:uncharacterized protein LOC101889385 [Musca domestica]|uniref:Uncharacterized protein LOC101889385 n=1 Tax=Musca domestica TaxID=7370 RepID=A0A1I8M1C5_MUSDO|nr:uncharacterized protein LOC101889385 [Musca domestica]
MAINGNLLKSQEFLSPQIFPQFDVRIKKITPGNETTFYPNHVKNLHGHSLRLGINNESTKAYVMRETSSNKFTLSGHVGSFFKVFADFHNASITLPHFRQKIEVTHVLLEAMVNNGTYDMSMELSINQYANDMVYSYTYDFLDWCIMVPMENPVPAYLFYVRIFDILSTVIVFCAVFVLTLLVALTFWLQDYTVYWFDTFFNVYIFNGILGHPFKMEINFTGVRSFLYLLTCVGGIIINSSFATYLQTYKARPPTEKPIMTLNDIRSSKLKIAFYKEEYKFMQANNLSRPYDDVAFLIDTYRDYYTLRDSYDTRFVYPVPSPQWSQYEQQQKFFAKPKFRLSDICIFKMIGVMIPMQPNSPFEDTVNQMIGIVNQAGLIQYWKSMEFLESLQRKRLTLFDGSTAISFEVMKFQDTKLLGYLFIIMISVSSLCFIAELYWPRRGRLARRLWKMRKLCSCFKKPVN